MTMIIASLFGIIGWIVLPETYAPTLLTNKARKIRLETRNWAVHSKQYVLVSSTRWHTWGICPADFTLH